MAMLDEMLSNTWSRYGRGDGWRNDLLVHPRQETMVDTSAAADNRRMSSSGMDHADLTGDR